MANKNLIYTANHKYLLFRNLLSNSHQLKGKCKEVVNHIFLCCAFEREENKVSLWT